MFVINPELFDLQIYSCNVCWLIGAGL